MFVVLTIAFFAAKQRVGRSKGKRCYPADVEKSTLTRHAMLN